MGGQACVWVFICVGLGVCTCMSAKVGIRFVSIEWTCVNECLYVHQYKDLGGIKYFMLMCEAASSIEVWPKSRAKKGNQ